MADHRALLTREYIECTDPTICNILKKEWEAVKYNLDRETWNYYQAMTDRINQGLEEMPDYSDIADDVKRVRHEAFLLYLQDVRDSGKYSYTTPYYVKNWANGDWSRLNNATRLEYIEKAKQMSCVKNA